MFSRPFLRPARLLALASLLALAACEDAPTAPTSYVQVVAGGTWVAVAEPPGMARLDTWLAWMPEEGLASSSVRSLRESAGRARSAGRIQEAMNLEELALRAMVRRLSRAPDAPFVLGPLAALDSWTDRARARLELGSYPELLAATAEVAAQADSARGALAGADTVRAVQHIARGTIAARRQSPLAVGLRLMAAIEARLPAADAPQSADVRRARHLLAGAREGLATGDSLRALRRAVYALQLLEAEGFTAPPPAGTVDSPRPQR